MIEKFTLFRYPMANSLSSYIHQAFAKQFGLEIEYTQTQVMPGELLEAITQFRQMGGVGANVTMPHKEAAFNLCDNTSDMARLTKSVNTLSWPNGKIQGDNTDGDGLLNDLQKHHGYSLEDKRICILGAGGAAAGIIAALVSVKPKHILICNRTHSRALDLQEQFKAIYPIEVVPIEQLGSISVDWIIKATPAFDLHGLNLKATRVYDIAYSKTGEPTEFMQTAKALGAIDVLDGLGMLVEQAALGFSIWHPGKIPETKELLRDLRQKIPLIPL